MPETDALSVAPETPDRNLALELVRVTEAAAMAAGRWVGRGDKNGADGSVLRDPAAASVGEALTLRLAGGALPATAGSPGS